MKKKYYEMDICPVCRKKFLYNPHSIYKIKVNNVTKCAAVINVGG